MGMKEAMLVIAIIGGLVLLAWLERGLVPLFRH
jgi:hypothetical protein